VATDQIVSSDETHGGAGGNQRRASAGPATSGGKGRAAKGSAAKGAGRQRRPPGISVAGHPRAALRVRQAKGFGGLVGFAIAAVLSLNAGVPLDQVGLRAIASGVGGYLIAWACSVAVWRQLVLAELRAHQEQHAAEAEANDSAMINVGTAATKAGSAVGDGEGPAPAAAAAGG
jgi:hypothetical protein